MVKQLSTSLSDGILALSAFHATYTIGRGNLAASFGFALIGSAATAGVLKFSQESPTDNLIYIHTTLAWLSSLIGVPALGAAYCQHVELNSLANVHYALGIAAIISWNVLNYKLQNLASTAVGGVALLSIAVICCLKFNPTGIIGAVLYVVAGLVIGIEGTLFGVLRVDWFHYALAVANIALMLGLSQKEKLVFYKAK
ncbi:unnamed protein product [Owenia fusiformis]|uniref:Uncharacterized protein n=1 Tax=Owenia fusiformis TaxID=6347 RepID=A0A8J1Y7R5_OWEFU|nr:unnamed protein product [Owenia fusiformis]